MTTQLEQLQADILGRLLSDPALATVVIVAEQKGVRTADLEQALGASVASYRAGAIKGVCIVVGMPSRRVPDEAIPGPRIETDVIVRCLERPLINRGTGGNGLTAEFLSLRVEQLLHNFVLRDLPCVLVSDGADPVVYESLDREYANHIQSSIQLAQLCKSPAPKITGSALEGVTITCTNAAAEILYTTDGSFPYPSNPAAVVYNALLLDQGGQPVLGQNGEPIFDQGASFNVASGTVVRAVSFVPNPTNPNQVASDLAAQLIT